MQLPKTVVVQRRLCSSCTWMKFLLLSVSVHVTWFAGIPNACAGGGTRVLEEGQHVHVACMSSVYNLSARMEHYALLGLASWSHAAKMQQISSIWMALAPSSSILMFLLAAEFMVLWGWQNFQNEDHIICLPKLLLTTTRSGPHNKLIVCSWDQINGLWKALVMEDSQHKSSKVTLSHTQLNCYLWCSAQQSALTKNHGLYMYKTPKCKICFKPSLQTHTLPVGEIIYNADMKDKGSINVKIFQLQEMLQWRSQILDGT